MNAIGLAAISGLTIFLGLPLARFEAIPRRLRALLNAGATGVLLFLFWDILSAAAEPVESAVHSVRQGHAGAFILLAAVFGGGLLVGLLGLSEINHRITSRMPPALASGPGAAAAGGASMPGAVSVGSTIAVGLGLHNFGEGLAIAAAWAAAQISLTGVLVVGFALHNLTEGFGIAAPLTLAPRRPSWRRLGALGLIAGGPTKVGAAFAPAITTPYAAVAALTLAAGALIPVLIEMLGVARRMNSQRALGAALLTGFLFAFATDLFLSGVAA